MNNSELAQWDEEIKKEAAVIGLEMEEWVPNSKNLFLEMFRTKLDFELQAFKEMLLLTNGNEEFLLSLVPPVIKDQYPENEKQMLYLRRTYEAMISMDMRIQIMEPKPDVGRILLCLGNFTYSREHILKFFTDKYEKVLPMSRALCNDFLYSKFRILRNAYAHGYLMPPAEGDRNIFFIGTEGSNTHERISLAKEYYVSVKTIIFSLRIYSSFLMNVFITLVH